MEEGEQIVKIPADADADADGVIARRLAETLRVVREDEAKHMRIIEMQRLRRRLERATQNK